jgi:hypothetical protein
MDPKKLAEGLSLSMDDVALCVRNAKRLMKDSSHVSPGTCLALRELALEELAKGSMVQFRIYIQDAVKGKWPATRSTAGPAPPELGELLDRNADLLTDEALKRAFWDHDIKLGHVALMVDFLELTIPAMETAKLDTRGLSIRTRTLSGLVKLGPLRRLGLRYLSENLVELRGRGIDRLDDLCKNALYVGLDKAGERCTAPSADPELVRILGVFNTMFAGALTTGVDRWRRDVRRSKAGAR